MNALLPLLSLPAFPSPQPLAYIAASAEVETEADRVAGEMPGLTNLGNTCFLAAAMQAIAASPSSSSSTFFELSSIPHGSFARTAADLLLKLCQGGEGMPINPRALVTQVRSIHRSLGIQ